MGIPSRFSGSMMPRAKITCSICYHNKINNKAITIFQKCPNTQLCPLQCHFLRFVKDTNALSKFSKIALSGNSLWGLEGSCTSHDRPATKIMMMVVVVVVAMIIMMVMMMVVLLVVVMIIMMIMMVLELMVIMVMLGMVLQQI